MSSHNRECYCKYSDFGLGTILLLPNSALVIIQPYHIIASRSNTTLRYVYLCYAKKDSPECWLQIDYQHWMLDISFYLSYSDNFVKETWKELVTTNPFTKCSLKKRNVHHSFTHTGWLFIWSRKDLKTFNGKKEVKKED